VTGPPGLVTGIRAAAAAALAQYGQATG